MRLGQPLIVLSRLEPFLQLEPALLVWGLLLLAWIVFKLLQRRGLSAKRKQVLERRFANAGGHGMVALFFFSAHWALVLVGGESALAERVAAWSGLAAILWGLFVLVRTSKILISEYLFWGHPKEGVPLLLIEIFTWMLAAVAGAWMLSNVFNVNLAPLLATSAALSVVLGFALQDTLGNLFAGIALQADKPCELGDWIEVHHDKSHWVGMVHEISWRATTLLAPTHELIIIPNRVMAQALVSNFSQDGKPVMRFQYFRVGHDTSFETAQRALLGALAQIPAVRKDPPPMLLLMESAESHLLLKLFFYLESYGDQWIVGSRINTDCVQALRGAGIEPVGLKVNLNS